MDHLYIGNNDDDDDDVDDDVDDGTFTNIWSIEHFLLYFGRQV